MNWRGLLIVVYIIMNYVIYGIHGEIGNSLWNLYKYACPVILVIGLLVLEIKGAVNKYLKFWYFGLIIVVLMYYLRIAYKYEPEHIEFVAKMNTRAVYWTPVIFSFVALLTILKLKR